MKKRYLLVSIVSVLTIGARPIDEFPQANISNGLIKAQIYLPDTSKGYYRGSRFDWSGVMPALEYKGHTYFGQWFDKYSPTLHDAIMGPVEAFAPIGYDKAKVGENFLAIGIGMLTKPEEPKYSFVTPYRLVNPGSWQVQKKSNQVQFIHTLQDKEYAYQYKKTVQLIKGKPKMALLHTLKNTGSQPIETTVYDHNFFVIDQQPTGPDFVVKFSFKPTSETPKSELGDIQDNQIRFSKMLSKSEHLYCPSLQGFSNSAKDYDIRIENQKTGAGVRITGDQPLFKLLFWSASTAVSPEPYLKIKVNPGEEISWKIFYEFYTLDKNK